MGPSASTSDNFDNNKYAGLSTGRDDWLDLIIQEGRLCRKGNTKQVMINFLIMKNPDNPVYNCPLAINSSAFNIAAPAAPRIVL